jgi:surfactin synthase thioesterase subunit
MDNWILGSPTDNCRRRMFCFHHAGGGASFYAPWIQPARAAGVELLPVQLPGRENRFREPLVRDFDELVSRTTDSLLPLLDRPFAVFGHSFGAKLAFELTRDLRRRGVRLPSTIIVSGAAAPHRSAGPDTLMARLGDDAFLNELSRRYGDTMTAISANEELKTLYLSILRADFEALAGYTYREEPPLDIPLCAYGGREDTTVTDLELKSWQDQATVNFRLRLYPGGHFYLRGQIQVLSDAIADSDVVDDLPSGPPRP